MIITSIWPDDGDADVLVVEDIIKQFNAMDATSMAFRYPVDKQDQRLLSADLRMLNLRHMAATMNKVANVLEGIACGIADYLLYAGDMAADFGDQTA